MQKIMNTISCITQGSRGSTRSPDHTEPVIDPLTTASWDSTPEFTLEGVFRCKVIDVYDGDTFTVATNIPGMGVRRVTCRLLGVDTAEMRYKATEPRWEELKQLAYRARDRVVRELTGTAVPEGYNRHDIRNLCTQSTKLVDVQFQGMDKYGRALAQVPCGDVSLTEILINERLALPYEGGTKQDITVLLG